MNPLSLLALKWYLFLTLLALFASITLPIVDIAPGLLAIWFFFIPFFIGSNSKFFPLQEKDLLRSSKATVRLPLGLLALGTIFASLYAAKFYTGKTIFEVLSSFRSGLSLYNSYQYYFTTQQLGLFSFSKLPAILCLFYLKIVDLYIFITLIILRKKITFRSCLYLAILIASQLYFSIARGTSFELFELILLLWFCVTIRAYIYNKKHLVTMPKLCFFLCTLVTVLIYSYNISARYSFKEIASCATADLCINQESVLYQLSVPLATLSYKLSGYFTFGIYYIANFLEKFWLADSVNFSSLLFPFASFYDQNLIPVLLCHKELDCGAAWVPDAITYLLILGIPLLMLTFFCIGILSEYLLHRALINRRFLELGASFFIFLTLVSFPIGNFIAVSSSNKLTILFLAIGLSFATAFKFIKALYKWLYSQYLFKLRIECSQIKNY